MKHRSDCRNLHRHDTSTGGFVCGPDTYLGIAPPPYANGELGRLLREQAHYERYNEYAHARFCDQAIAAVTTDQAPEDDGTCPRCGNYTTQPDGIIYCSRCGWDSETSPDGN